jgi:polyvinyl alcohol dehydrogenase (cytochrome)
MKLSALLCVAGLAAAAPSGEQVYKTRCASCHDQATARIPAKDALQRLPATRILKTLDFGLMMSIAYPLKREERVAVANYLGTATAEQNKLANACSGKNPLSGSPAGNWNGWSATGDNARYQKAEAAGVSFDQVRNLKLKWAFGFAGDITAFAAPTVFNGTVFTGSAGGIMYALDARTGCTHWQFEANGPVRMAPLVASDGKQTALVFGDQIGWVYSINAATGKQLWRKRIEEHEATRLTGSPVALDGIVYIPAASWEETRSLDPQYPCCTFRGSLTALRIKDGSQVWKTFMIDAPKRTGATRTGTPTFGPSGAGIWSAPTIDTARGVIYVTTGDNFSHPATLTSDSIIALNLKTGRIQWASQTLPNDVYNSACSTPGAPNCPVNAGPDYDFGSSALLLKTENGRTILAAGQKSGVVFALDPDQKGKILWQTRVGKGGINGGVQWGMASDGQRVFASTGDAVRQGATADRTATVIGNANFDPRAGGGVTALRIADGSKAWFTEPQPCNPPRPGCNPAQSGALTALPGVVFSGSVDGHIRAYSAEDGKVIWDLDTAREFSTVNGVAARGGSLDGAGPVISSGMVFLNSGYPRNGGMPGNVLLAFGPE